MLNVSRVASGTDGITSASGSWHAVASVASDAVNFTRYGGYSTTFPAGGYTTSADIYLDTTASTGDARSVLRLVIGDHQPEGGYGRDFIFNVGTDGNGGFVVSASNNARREPVIPGRVRTPIMTSGWYTFQHHFYNIGGVLAADLSVRHLGAATPLATWTLSDPSDIIGTDHGRQPLRLAPQQHAGDRARQHHAIRCLHADRLRQRRHRPHRSADRRQCDRHPRRDRLQHRRLLRPGTTGSVSGADIHGANYYGVVVNAAAVNVTNSSIHDIGESPLNGSQHGVGVFYTTLNQDSTSTGTAATGTVSGNIFTKYQKGGIVVNGPGASVTISGNTVTGEGRVAYIAQNGIQVSRGATGTITGNTVTGNAYTGTNIASSSGILLIGGYVYGPITTGVWITNNTLIENDMGVYVYNADASGSNPPSTKTKNSIVNNTITNARPRTSPATALAATRSGSTTSATRTTSSTTRSAASATTPIRAGSFFDPARPHWQHEAALQQQRLAPARQLMHRRGPLRRAFLCLCDLCGGKSPRALRAAAGRSLCSG